MKKSSLSEQCREAILGTLLGDGSLKVNKHYKNARLAFRHSMKQKEYFFWKVDLLQEVCGPRFSWVQQPDGKSSSQMLRFQSKALEGLTGLHDLTHEKGAKRVRRRWLNHLTPLSLALWWQDDGSIIANGRKGVLCTDSFSYEEQKLLARYLLKVWGVRVHIGKASGQNKVWRLWFRSTEELKKFLRIILPHMRVPQMLPKVLLLYKDSDLQQRWISEVANLSRFSFEVINDYLEKKKQKWQQFRE